MVCDGKLHSRVLAALLIGQLAPGCGSSSGTSTSMTGGGSTGGSAATDATTGTDTGGSPTTGGTRDGSGSGTGDATTGIAVDCTPILNQAQLETGFEVCDDGSTQRYAAIECPMEETVQPSPCMPGPTSCVVDTDCSDQALGYCAEAHMLAHYCGCSYGCRSDSDCGAGSICECGVVVGHCVSATCTTNADCAPGFGCVATVNGTAPPACSSNATGLPSSYRCQAADDECQGDQDCPADGSNRGACLFDGDHRVCGTICAMTPLPP